MDIVLYLFDVNEIEKDELHTIIEEIKTVNPNIILVANKADVLQQSSVAPFANEIFISAREGQGIEELKNSLFALAGGKGIQNENVIITNARHYAALAEIAKSIQEIKKGLSNHLTGDFLAIDINRCLHFLGEITGEITNEDRLDYIFSKFCIGK